MHFDLFSDLATKMPVMVVEGNVRLLPLRLPICFYFLSLVSYRETSKNKLFLHSTTWPSVLLSVLAALSCTSICDKSPMLLIDKVVKHYNGPVLPLNLQKVSSDVVQHERDWPNTDDRFQNQATDSGGECGIPTWLRYQVCYYLYTYIRRHVYIYIPCLCHDPLSDSLVLWHLIISATLSPATHSD